MLPGLLDFKSKPFFHNNYKHSFVICWLAMRIDVSYILTVVDHLRPKFK